MLRPRDDKKTTWIVLSENIYSKQPLFVQCFLHDGNIKKLCDCGLKTIVESALEP